MRFGRVAAVTRNFALRTAICIRGDLPYMCICPTNYNIFTINTNINTSRHRPSASGWICPTTYHVMLWLISSVVGPFPQNHLECSTLNYWTLHASFSPVLLCGPVSPGRTVAGSAATRPRTRSPGSSAAASTSPSPCRRSPTATAKIWILWKFVESIFWFAVPYCKRPASFSLAFWAKCFLEDWGLSSVGQWKCKQWHLAKCMAQKAESMA